MLEPARSSMKQTKQGLEFLVLCGCTCHSTIYILSNYQPSTPFSLQPPIPLITPITKNTTHQKTQQSATKKTMKMRKNKGKIHPSPSSSSSSLSTPPSNSLPNQNALSVLALLPAAILALISVLSAEDKEVLAYMVTRSMNSVNPSHSSSAEEKNKKSSNGKKLLGSSSSSSSSGVVHKAPFFDCECFDCYTSYWFRWDSSPDKELIHKAIEEFEEFLFNQEQAKRSSSSGKGKRRERIGRRGREKAKEEVLEEGFDVGVVGNEAESEAAVAVEVEVEEVAVVEVGREAAAAAAVVDNYNKGLVRKVLPDVVGLFNSRLWGLWSPNV